jgi:hypothetical protein
VPGVRGEEPVQGDEGLGAPAQRGLRPGQEVPGPEHLGVARGQLAELRERALLGVTLVRLNVERGSGEREPGVDRVAARARGELPHHGVIAGQRVVGGIGSGHLGRRLGIAAERLQCLERRVGELS